MNAELFVAQLDWSVTEDELGEICSQYGEVVSVRIPTDRMTGKKRGFGFVMMGAPEQAQAAIQGLDQWELKGRNLVVKLSEPRPQQSGGNRGQGYGPPRRGGYSNQY